MGVTEILCSFRLVLEGKTGKEIPESSRLELLEKFSANNFALSDAEDNTSGPLNRGGIASRFVFAENAIGNSPKFPNIVKNLKIPEYENLTRSFEKVKDPALNAILKYKNHPNIIAIKEKSKNSTFTFHEVDIEKIIKEIKRLNNKASQKSDIPITIICENADILADFLAESLKGTIKTYNFPNCLKLTDITPLHKKGEKTTRKTINRLVFYQRYLKY